jgi:hypothetical protein
MFLESIKWNNSLKKGSLPHCYCFLVLQSTCGIYSSRAEITQWYMILAYEAIPLPLAVF